MILNLTLKSCLIIKRFFVPLCSQKQDPYL